MTSDSAPSICYICEATSGGVRKQLRELIQFFSKENEKLNIHCLLGDRGEPGFQEELAQWSNLGINAEVNPKFQRSLRPLKDYSSYKWLKKRLREINPDVVHTHCAKAGFLGRLAANSTGIKKVVHTPHVFPFQWAAGIKRSFYKRLEIYAGKRCHKIVCVGDDQKESISKESIVPDEKLIVIKNGIEVPELLTDSEHEQLRKKLNLSKDARVVGMVARLAPQKGLKLFIDAAATVTQKQPETIFYLIGDGPLKEETEKYAESKGLTKFNFRFLGHRDDAFQLYPAFNVLALSSLYEGLPYVLLEASSWGVPIVATDVLGSREIVADGETGFLVPPRRDSASLLADCIIQFITDDGLCHKFGKAARLRVEKHFPQKEFFHLHKNLYLS